MLLLCSLRFDLCVVVRTMLVAPAEHARYQLQPLCEHLAATASAFHRFYGQHRVLGHERQDVRLAIVKGTHAVLKTGLHLIGVEALERI